MVLPNKERRDTTHRKITLHTRRLFISWKRVKRPSRGWSLRSTSARSGSVSLENVDIKAGSEHTMETGLSRCTLMRRGARNRGRHRIPPEGWTHVVEQPTRRRQHRDLRRGRSKSEVPLTNVPWVNRARAYCSRSHRFSVMGPIYRRPRPVR